jgi:hypothetical protein
MVEVEFLNALYYLLKGRWMSNQDANLLYRLAREHKLSLWRGDNE